MNFVHPCILPESSTIPTYIVMYVTSLNCSENVVKKGVMKQELTFKLSSVPSITIMMPKHLLMLLLKRMLVFQVFPEKKQGTTFFML